MTLSQAQAFVRRNASIIFILVGVLLLAYAGAKLDLPLAAATKKQYDRMVTAGLGELDKSGVAELTFKGRAPAKAV